MQAQVCWQCGSMLQPATVVCPVCGVQQRDNAAPVDMHGGYPGYAGQQLPPAAYAQAPVQQTSAHHAPAPYAAAAPTHQGVDFAFVAGTRTPPGTPRSTQRIASMYALGDAFVGAPAGIGTRILSLLIDLAAIAIVGVGAWLLSSSWLLGVVAGLEVAIIFVVTQARTGASLGKLITRTRVSRVDAPRSPGLIRSGIRATITGAGALIAAVGAVVVEVTAAADSTGRRRTIADRAARTVVVSIPSEQARIEAEEVAQESAHSEYLATLSDGGTDLAAAGADVPEVYVPAVSTPEPAVAQPAVASAQAPAAMPGVPGMPARADAPGLRGLAPVEPAPVEPAPQFGVRQAPMAEADGSVGPRRTPMSAAVEQMSSDADEMAGPRRRGNAGAAVTPDVPVGSPSAPGAPLIPVPAEPAVPAPVEPAVPAPVGPVVASPVLPAVPAPAPNSAPNPAPNPASSNAVAPTPASNAVSPSPAPNAAAPNASASNAPAPNAPAPNAVAPTPAPAAAPPAAPDAPAPNPAEPPRRTRRASFVPESGGTVLTFDTGQRETVAAYSIVSLGRAPSATGGEDQLIVVADSSTTISKNHARWEEDRTGVWMTDLGSTNGTELIFADGRTMVLTPGVRTSATGVARIRLGDRTFTMSPLNGGSA